MHFVRPINDCKAHEGVWWSPSASSGTQGRVYQSRRSVIRRYICSLSCVCLANSLGQKSLLTHSAFTANKAGRGEWWHQRKSCFFTTELSNRSSHTHITHFHSCFCVSYTLELPHIHIPLYSLCRATIQTCIQTVKLATSRVKLKQGSVPQYRKWCNWTGRWEEPTIYTHIEDTQKTKDIP